MTKVQKFCQRCKRVGLKQIAQQTGDSWKDLLLEKNMLGIGSVMVYDIRKSNICAAHWKLVVSDDDDELVCFILFVGCNFIGSPMIVLFIGLESKVMRECCFVVERDAWLKGEFTLSSLDVLQEFSFFLQMGFTLILATIDGLDVGLLGDIIGEYDYVDDG
ncbi:hypothetical protein Tco_0610452 [Tanacetum coccineum]